MGCMITHLNFGVSVSHSFGYGLMDATAMVQLAKKWQTVPEQHKCEMLAPHKNRYGFFNFFTVVNHFMSVNFIKFMILKK